MFFVLSKLMNVFVILPKLFTAVGLLGLGLYLTRFAKVASILVSVGFLGIVICGVSPLGSLLLLPLEQRFPQFKPDQQEPVGIVVLGGSIDPDMSAARQLVVPVSGIDRVITAVKMARRYPRARIIYSGGTANLVLDNAREADYAKSLFTDLGIEESRVTVERDSRNTHENAIYSRALADPKPGEKWLLVTSAFHMPRSMGLFRKAGFPVEPVPADWRTSGKVELSPVEFPKGILQVYAACHEWAGLVAYWITGKIDSVFPGP